MSMISNGVKKYFRKLPRVEYKIFLTVFLLAVMAVTIPGNASAAPAISGVSGTTSQGNTITISGSGFGMKSPAKPIVWADFENLSVGAAASQNSTYSAGKITLGGQTLTINSSDLPHSNSSKSARAYTYTTVKVSPNMATSDGGGSSQVFVFARRKWAHDEYFNNLTNYKMLRIWPTTGDLYIDDIFGYHNFSGQINHPFTYPYANSLTGYSWEGGTPGSTQTDLGSPNIGHFRNNQWGVEEYQISKGDLDIPNGTLRLWYNGIKYRNTTNVVNRKTAHPNLYSKIVLENFNTNSNQDPAFLGKDHPPSYSYVYYDDVYIDKTWSRVMIGNASTFDASTHREPLIPTAWSAGSITAYFNQGSFSNGQQAYVFVIDSDGNASPGRAITISGTPPPAQSCGDQTCNNGETFSTCSQDCPSPAKTYNLTDFAKLVTDWLKSITGSPADINLDSKVNSKDLGIMMSNWSL